MIAKRAVGIMSHLAQSIEGSRIVYAPYGYRMGLNCIQLHCSSSSPKVSILSNTIILFAKMMISLTLNPRKNQYQGSKDSLYLTYESMSNPAEICE